MIGAKPLRIRLNKADGFIRVYDGTRYLVLFGGEAFDFIYNRIRYIKGVRKDITYVFSHNFAKIIVDSLPLENSLTFHNAIIQIKSVWNKSQSRYHYNIVVESNNKL